MHAVLLELVQPRLTLLGFSKGKAIGEVSSACARARLQLPSSSSLSGSLRRRGRERPRLHALWLERHCRVSFERSL